MLLILIELEGAAVPRGTTMEVMKKKKSNSFDYRREVKAIREDCPPGKEEGKKALSSMSTSFPRCWKSRPAQRITGAI
nr:hypothetical protein CTI12_AA549300 [Tanacetum cinerariifolium]